MLLGARCADGSVGLKLRGSMVRPMLGAWASSLVHSTYGTEVLLLLYRVTIGHVYICSTQVQRPMCITQPDDVEPNNPPLFARARCRCTLQAAVDLLPSIDESRWQLVRGMGPILRVKMVEMREYLPGKEGVVPCRHTNMRTHAMAPFHVGWWTRVQQLGRA